MTPYYIMQLFKVCNSNAKSSQKILFVYKTYKSYTYMYKYKSISISCLIFICISIRQLAQQQFSLFKSSNLILHLFPACLGERCPLNGGCRAKLLRAGNQQADAGDAAALQQRKACRLQHIPVLPQGINPQLASVHKDAGSKVKHRVQTHKACKHSSRNSCDGDYTVTNRANPNLNV